MVPSAVTIVAVAALQTTLLHAAVNANDADRYATAWAESLASWTRDLVASDTITFALHNASVRHFSTPLDTSSLPSCADHHLLQLNQDAAQSMHAVMIPLVYTSRNDTSLAKMQREMQVVAPDIVDCFSSHDTATVARGVWTQLTVLCGPENVIFHTTGHGGSVFEVDSSFNVTAKQAKSQVRSWGAHGSSEGAVEDDDAGEERHAGAERVHQSVQECVAVKGRVLTVQSIVGGGWSLRRGNGSNVVSGYATAFELVVADVAVEGASDKWVRGAANSAATSLYQAGHACAASSNECYMNPLADPRRVMLSLAAKWKILSDHTYLVVYSGAIVFALLVFLSAATLASTQRRVGYTTIPDPIEVDYDSCSSDDDEYF